MTRIINNINKSHPQVCYYVTYLILDVPRTQVRVVRGLNPASHRGPRRHKCPTETLRVRGHQRGLQSRPKRRGRPGFRVATGEGAVGPILPPRTRCQFFHQGDESRSQLAEGGDDGREKDRFPLMEARRNTSRDAPGRLHPPT